ncbi:CheR family methyltransferase [Armatimonas sp.]|uniref:CheR family methyltransferase n=1 Tax=Armatimonas sp. TaxID=1872638 RepID=UPI00374D75A4
MSPLTKADFDYICDLVYKRSAIVLDSSKEYLVQSRLASVTNQNGCASLAELVTGLRTQPSGRLSQMVVEVMTTNETSFFRDLHPFEALKKVVIPELLAKRPGEPHVMIWCAAASSGQEPYSIALLLREHFPQISQGNVRIIATDLNTQVLEQARQGIYSQIEVNRGLPVTMLMRYFEKSGVNWQLREDIRHMVEFRECNLIQPWPLIPPVDILFLRNVLIYFDQETKKSILAKVRRTLKPDAALFLGGAETTMNIDDCFERVPLEKTAYYRVRKAT